MIERFLNCLKFIVVMLYIIIAVPIGFIFGVLSLLIFFLGSPLLFLLILGGVMTLYKYVFDFCWSHLVKFGGV